MAARKPWWRRLAGAPGAFTGRDGGLPAPSPGATRAELLFLAALSVVTGIVTQADLLIVPVGAALLLLARLGARELGRVVGLGSAGSSGRSGRKDWS